MDTVKTNTLQDSVLMAIFFLIPLVFYHDGYNIYLLNKLIAGEIIIFAIAGVFLISGAVINKGLKELAVLVCLLTVSTCLVFFATRYRYVSAVRLVEVLFFFGLLFLTANMRTGTASIRKYLLALSVSNIMVCVVGIMNSFGIDLFDLSINLGGTREGRIISTFGNKNYFAEYLAVVIPFFGCAMLLKEHLYFKILSGASFILSMALILLTNSRSAWVGLFFSAVFCLFVLLRNKLFPAGSLRIMIPVVIILSVIVTAVSGIFGTAEKVASMFSLRQSYTNVQRILVWKATMDMIRDKPVTGFSWGNFKIFNAGYMKWLTPEQKRTVFGKEGGWFETHNEYLQFWVEAGTFFFGALIYAVFFIVYIVLKNIQFLESSRKIIVTGLLGGVVAVLGDAFFSFPFHLPSSYVFFWIFLGLAVAMILPSERTALIRNRIPAVIALSALLIFYALIFIKIGISDVRFKRASTLWESGRHEYAFAEYKKSYELYDKNTLVQYGLGSYYAEMKDYEKSERFYGEGIDIDPFPHLYLKLGLLQTEYGKLGLSAGNFREAIVGIPTFDIAYFNLGVAYTGLGRTDKAIQSYRQGLFYDPGNERVRVSLDGLLKKNGLLEKKGR